MITIAHTRADGTLVDGTARGDGSAPILKAAGFRWFGSLRMWGLQQSRDKAAKTWRINQAAEALRKAGFEVTVEINDEERRSFAEAEAERYERAERRADYHTEHAGKAEASSAAAWQAEHGILDMIPMGQPILVGHHSERRHRRDLDRAESLRRRGMAEAERAEYHGDRAEAAERFQARRESIPTTLRRIEKLEAEERGVQRDIAGRMDWVDNGNGGSKLALVKPSGAYLERLNARAADLAEQLAYWRDHVAKREAEGVKVWSAADFTKGDFVRNGNRWYQVERVNAKSLSVPHGNNDHLLALVTRDKVTHAMGPSQWTRKITYDEVRGRKSAEEMAEILAEAERRAQAS